MKQIAKPTFVFLTVAVLATLYAYVQLGAAPTGTAVANYQKAYRSIEGEVSPQDVVLIHPPWRHDVVSALTAPKKMTQRTVTTALPKHAGKTGKIWVLADPRGPDLPLRLQRMHLTQPATLTDGIQTSVLENQKPGAGVNFAQMISDAEVKVVEKSGKQTRCTWSTRRQRFLCKKLPNWMYVGPYQMKSGRDDKTCIWSHPISKGKVHVTFPVPAITSRLIFEHAFSDKAARSKNRSPVTVSINAGGRLLKNVSLARKRGFSQSSFVLPEPQAKSLEVVVETENDGLGHYCFNLFSKPESSPR